MTIFALLVVLESVRELLADEAPGINVVFGWKEPAKTINQGAGGAARITFVPGDSGDSVGEDAPARFPGRNPRPIGTLKEYFRVRMWAVDATRLNDEQAQYEAVRLLYDTTRRALHLCDPGGLKVRSQTWIRNNPERQFGMEIEMTCSVDAMIPDLPWEESTDMRGRTGFLVALANGEIDPNPGTIVSG